MNHFIGNFVLMTLHAASAFISRINSNNALGLQNRQRLPVLHINIAFRLFITCSDWICYQTILEWVKSISVTGRGVGWLYVDQQKNGVRIILIYIAQCSACSRFRVRALNQFCLGQRSLSQHRNPKHFPHNQFTCNLSFWNLHNPIPLYCIYSHDKSMT